VSAVTAALVVGETAAAAAAEKEEVSAEAAVPGAGRLGSEVAS